MKDKQRNQEEFLRILREGIDTNDPDEVSEFRNKLKSLNQEYFPVSEPVGVKVPAS